jgi:DNA-binding transcriptional MerR regulator/methylmalonyl-CoA mutase cobalamin-binding subunit
VRKIPLADSGAEATHPIQVVARRTGISADVIRAWERRYRAVVPQRSATGRRLYSDEDLQRLLLLGQAIGGGRRIGDVAHLSSTELKDLIGSDRDALSQVSGSSRQAAKSEEKPASAKQDQVAADYIEACLHAAELMDPQALEDLLSRAAVSYSVPVFLHEIVAGLMLEIGRRWQAGAMRLCHEHMTTAVIRSFLGSMASASSGNMVTDSAPVLLVTTPDGQLHELGALMVALTAAARGWRALYLGSSTPVDEITFAVLAKSVRAVALSISYPKDDPRLPQTLIKLRRQLPADVAILVGGAAASGYQNVLEDIGAILPSGLEALQSELDRLRSKSVPAASMTIG